MFSSFHIYFSDMYTTRIVHSDYYLSEPLKGLDVCYNEDRASDIAKVPVIRIFGATPAGIIST